MKPKDSADGAESQIHTLPGFGLSGRDVNQIYTFDDRPYSPPKKLTDEQAMLDVISTQGFDEIDLLTMESSPASTEEMRAAARQALSELKQVSDFEDMQAWEEWQ